MGVGPGTRSVAGESKILCETLRFSKETVPDEGGEGR